MIKKMKHSEDEAKKLKKEAEEAAKQMKQEESEEGEAKQAESEESEEAEEEEEKKESEDEAMDPEQDPEHGDIEKDKALILQMIKKYMGSEEEPEEAMEMAHKAYEAYHEMGYESEEAMKCAAHSMKLAKHMASKKQSEAEKCEDEAKKETVPQNPKADPKKYAGAKESEVKLAARVAFLERELKKRELGDMLDKKLKESGLGRAETDKIRSLIGTPKSESQIVETIKIFKEAFGVRGGEAVSKKGDFFVAMERAAAPVKKTGKVNFSDI